MTRSTNKNRDGKAALAAIRKLPWTEQREAIRDLATSDAPETVAVLMRLLDARDSDVRHEALEALWKRDPVLGRIAARAVLHDANMLVRDAAAEILGARGAVRQDVRRLKYVLQDADWVVRATAADSIGYIGGKAAQALLKKAMVEDPISIVRRDAAYAFSYAGDTTVIPDLAQALAEEEAERAHVGLLSALYALGQSGRLTPLLDLLRSEDDYVRYAVVHILEETIRPEDLEATVLALQEMLVRENNPGLKTDAGRIAELLAASIPNGGGLEGEAE